MALAIGLTSCVIALGYVMLGLLPMILFTFGFLGGLLVWLMSRANPDWRAIRLPFFLTLAAFVLHKLEERYLDFFPALSRITGVRPPETDSIFVYALYALAATWLLIPVLVPRRADFGYYLAWTFFVSMGVIELAHFVFPLLTGGDYGYFPGMASAVILAPLGWWGMWRLARGNVRPDRTSGA